MSTQLHDQMSALFTEVDEQQPAVEVAEIIDRAGPVRPTPDGQSPESGFPRRGVWIAVAAAVIALLVIGLAPLLSPNDSDRSPATNPPDTSIPAEVTTIPADGDASPEEILPDLVTPLGTLTWTRLEGTAETIPTGVAADPEGGYIEIEYPFVWHSDDALTWTRSEIDDPGLAGYEHVDFDDDWAMAWTDMADDPEVLQRVAGTWQVVDLPEPTLPALSGVVWETFLYPEVVRSDDVALIGGVGRGRIPWEDYYGTFEVDCGREEPCIEPPRAQWDQESQTLRLYDLDSLWNWEEEDPTPLAVLAIATDGDRVTFTDAESGEVIHEIGATADYPAADVVDGIQAEGSLPFDWVWASTTGDNFEFHPVPWTGDRTLVLNPSGGFAAFVYQRRASLADPPPADLELWTSQDGATWVDRGAPAFLGEAKESGQVEDVLVDFTGGRLVATVVTGFDESTGFDIAESWESADGLTWTKVDAEFPPFVSIEETDFGYLAAGLPQSRWVLWVSADGDTWEAVEGPPGAHEPQGAGGAGAGGAGDVIWVAINEEELGTRTLWIGRFE